MDTYTFNVSVGDWARISIALTRIAREHEEDGRLLTAAAMRMTRARLQEQAKEQFHARLDEEPTP